MLFRSLEDLESDDYMSVTNPAIAITSSSSKKSVIPEKELRGTKRQELLRNLDTQENTRDEHNLIIDLSTKRNLSSLKKNASTENALTEARRQELLQAPVIQDSSENESNIISDPFTDADEDHVYNAGLVILWPYLPRLFRNLEMIDDNNFVDVDTAERAALSAAIPGRTRYGNTRIIIIIKQAFVWFRTILAITFRFYADGKGAN